MYVHRKQMFNRIKQYLLNKCEHDDVETLHIFPQVKSNKTFERKILNIFFPISFHI